MAVSGTVARDVAEEESRDSAGRRATEAAPWRLLSLPRRRPAWAETKLGHPMLGIIAVVLIVMWLLGFFAFHLTTAAIHVLLIIAVVLVVLHFMRGRRGI
jgi:Flp pilus assembly protein TadB